MRNDGMTYTTPVDPDRRWNTNPQATRTPHMRYRTKPSEIQAVQWRGDNFQELVDFGATVDRGPDGDGRLLLEAGKDGAQGWVPVPVGHWIVRNPGDLTDHWPIDDDYFAGKYEAVTP
jgi:hypothetical protein